MIPTTNMISINVKPEREDDLAERFIGWTISAEVVHDNTQLQVLPRKVHATAWGRVVKVSVLIEALLPLPSIP